jgi:RHS repeat-associated protein
MNRLHKIQDPVPTPTDLVVNTYDELSRLTDQVFETGASAHFDYDEASRIKLIAHKDPSSTVLQSLNYAIDPTGAVDDIVDSLAGTLDYTYDLTKQLTDVSYEAAHPGENTSFVYDNAGNRDTVSIGTAPLVVDYTPDAMNQYSDIGGVIQGYDSNGNLEDDGTRLFAWDSESQLLVSDNGGGTTADYAYDPFGRRIRKTVNTGGPDVDTWYVWGGDRLLEEHDDAGAMVARYSYGSGFAPVRVELDSGSGLKAYYVHSDHLDTPRMLTKGAGVTGSGEFAWGADYLAFGEAKLDGGNIVNFNLRFPGQYFDAETGLHYNMHRYYDPASGRYISSDPIGQSDHTNPYQYAQNGPTNDIDPLGLYSSMEFLIDASNFSSGFGNTISFGLTGRINDATGASSVVDQCSGLYSAGEWTGIAWGFAAGGAGGLRAAGAKGVGKEFSHWIPGRHLRSLSSRLGARGQKFVNQTFGRSRANGNFVSAQRHFRHDPYRYPRGWREMGDRFGSVGRQLDRVPSALYGAAAGGALTGASAAAQ